MFWVWAHAQIFRRCHILRSVCEVCASVDVPREVTPGQLGDPENTAFRLPLLLLFCYGSRVSGKSAAHTSQKRPRNLWSPRCKTRRQILSGFIKRHLRVWNKSPPIPNTTLRTCAFSQTYTDLLDLLLLAISIPQQILTPNAMFTL